MTANAKFLFDVNFEERGPGERREPRFSEAELAAAEERGRDRGAAEARTEAEHKTAQALTMIAAQIRSLAEAQRESAAKAERTAIEIAAAIMRKVMPSYAEHHGLAEIESTVKACLARVPDEPRVVVRAPESLLDHLQSRMAEIAASAGFPGGIALLADQRLGPADCRVEWADGGADRDTARLWADIDAALARALTRPIESAHPSAAHESNAYQGDAHG
ncbi:MAG: FliH/SctL family protein [Alphaproteobacteria bacterium]